MERSLSDKVLGRNKPRTSMVSTLVDENTTIDGKVTFTGTLVVNGKINGDVCSNSSQSADDTVIVNGSGQVIADNLVIKHLIVKGALDANSIQCRTLEIAPTGKVNCKDLSYDIIRIAGGGKLVGSAKMNTIQAASSPAKPGLKSVTSVAATA